MLQHPDGLCHPERSEGSVNVSKATVLTYSDSSSYRPQNDIDSIEKLLAKVELFIVELQEFRSSDNTSACIEAKLLSELLNFCNS